MSLESRIKEIKDRNSKAIIEKAKAEERLKNLQEQKAQIEKQCETLGVDPLQLDNKIAEQAQKIEALTKKAEELLGIKEDSDDNPF